MSSEIILQIIKVVFFFLKRIKVVPTSRILLMMPFSTGTGMERVGVVGLD